MSRHRWIIITGLVMALAAVFLFTRQAMPWDAAVTKRLQQISDGVVSKDLRAVMSGVSRNYSDKYGNSYDDIKWKLALEFRRKGDPAVRLQKEALQRLNEDMAVAHINYSIELPESPVWKGDADVTFVREGRDWHVKSVVLQDEDAISALMEE